jgi:hypothetical protein
MPFRNSHVEEFPIIEQITRNIVSCHAPARKSWNVRTKGNGDAKLVKLINVGVEAEFTKGEWEGVKDALADTVSYRECVVRVLPMFLEKFAPTAKTTGPTIPQHQLNYHRFTFSNLLEQWGVQFEGSGNVFLLEKYIIIERVTFRRGRPPAPGDLQPTIKGFMVGILPEKETVLCYSEPIVVEKTFSHDEDQLVVQNALLTIDIGGLDLSNRRLIFTGIDPTGGGIGLHTVPIVTCQRSNEICL